MLCVSGTAVADETSALPASDSATWYIVGGPEEDRESSGLGSDSGEKPSRVDLGVTFSRLAPTEVITFTAGPAASSGGEGDGSYSFLVSGAYDFDIGTLVTPRIVGGVGVSYLGAERANSLAASDPTARRQMAPTAQIGFGADFDLGESWAVSAEYRAMYLGETQRPGSLGESRLDQKFTVGAKIRF